jgi:hypothetical protein
MAPETDDARMWLASLAAATAGGMPRKIRSGVARKPPPTPTRPARNPMPAPSVTINSRLTVVSAMGR